MSQSSNQISSRMRKEVRYSALTTMSMRLLKLHEIYEVSKETAKMMQIKDQKNFSIIALRLLLLHRNLTNTMSYSVVEAADYISKYFQENLMEVLKSKFCKAGQNNSAAFIEKAYETNLKDIEVFHRILRTGMDDPSVVRDLVLGLFEKVDGRYGPTQAKAAANLTTIFCVQGREQNLEMRASSQQKNLQLISTLVDSELCFQDINKEVNQVPHDVVGLFDEESDSIGPMLKWGIPAQDSIFESEFNLPNQGCVDYD